ncbi:hypothetical protein CONPUDRAFT_155342 [Coniophora puteana RWD-64-598 SS2]|uniref:Uncharacterized protein n=1 Tax=Coniophora puteana (strain RWD-64-598) TaxID=741705 RepID=A0A5M3MLI1_CONPW|nr:uncharacterized protein CONPUDRAFT_155342 [Coniophora puteana RWD-64-598 SS2]EIW79953.1 hypothetical protein CONPUDRAFT_155342 [Coniophora puteana RWD-64-598 SS2]
MLVGCGGGDRTSLILPAAKPPAELGPSVSYTFEVVLMLPFLAELDDAAELNADMEVPGGLNVHEGQVRGVVGEHVAGCMACVLGYGEDKVEGEGTGAGDNKEGEDDEGAEEEMDERRGERLRK